MTSADYVAFLVTTKLTQDEHLESKSTATKNTDVKVKVQIQLLY